MIVVTDHGYTSMLRAIADRVAQVKLFTNDGDIRDLSSLREPLSPEYQPRSLSLGQWQADGRTIKGPMMVWEFTKAFGSVYGWVGVDSAGLVLCGEKFSKPVNFEDFGGRIRVTPIIGIR